MSGYSYAVTNNQYKHKIPDEMESRLDCGHYNNSLLDQPCSFKARGCIPLQALDSGGPVI